MTVAFPWSGRDFNALVPMSGRAAVPNTPAGTGFNWPSLTGRISGYIRPVSGWKTGMSGLGQVDVSVLPGDITTDPGAWVTQNPSGMYDVSTSSTMASAAASGASSASSQAPWWGNILGTAISSGLKVGSQIASYELNPLTSKATYYQTPQGAVYASNVPSGSVVPGLTTGTGASILPILLIGGVVVMFMMSRR